MADQRIVYTYSMHLDQALISVSVATVELRPEGAGTRLVLTEQGAYLDGFDDTGERERGTAELLDALGAELRREPPAAAEPGGPDAQALLVHVVSLDGFYEGPNGEFDWPVVDQEFNRENVAEEIAKLKQEPGNVLLTYRPA